MSDALLTISGLETRYRTSRGDLRAVDGASLTVRSGEAVGLVGESGCGKSALGQSIMRLIQPPGRITGGRIEFAGRDLLTLGDREMRRLRGREIAMIFQDPMATLDPVQRIGDQIAELLEFHTDLGRAAIRKRVVEMLEQVGIPQPAARYRNYPHEFSGGMQQRAIIAAALILQPRLVIADEPTTALDVTVQAQILDLLRRLQESRTNTAIILVSHDLGVVSQLCDRVCVMYSGEVIEEASTGEILADPRHPYTVGLIASMPRLDVEGQTLNPIPGSVPDAINPPPGCKFAPRCPRAMDRCRVERPVLRDQGSGRSVACHLYD
ncbi:MAG: ABC transporter ATP-binding protein [Azospirillaceae bacterium]